MNDSDSSSTSVLINRFPVNDDTDNDIEELPTKKYRGASKFYDFYKSYASLPECLEEINNNRIEDTKWAKKQKRETNNGEKRYYKCSNCTKHLYILLHPTDFGVSIFLEDVEHDHSEESDLIQNRTKEKVLQLYFEQGKKTNYICRWLKQNLHQKHIELTPVQVNNLISRVKRNKKQQDHSKKCAPLLLRKSLGPVSPQLNPNLDAHPEEPSKRKRGRPRKNH